MTSKQELLKQVEESSLREDPLHFEVGDTVDVHTRILEGDKERVQVFSGIVLARRGGGTRETFTVRRIVSGEGVERTFPVHSPKIAKLEIKRHGRTRRSKLFYLRNGLARRLAWPNAESWCPGHPLRQTKRSSMTRQLQLKRSPKKWSRRPTAKRPPSN